MLSSSHLQSENVHGHSLVIILDSIILVVLRGSIDFINMLYH